LGAQNRWGVPGFQRTARWRKAEPHTKREESRRIFNTVVMEGLGNNDDSQKRPTRGGKIFQTDMWGTKKKWQLGSKQKEGLPTGVGMSLSNVRVQTGGLNTLKGGQEAGTQGISSVHVQCKTGQKRKGRSVVIARRVEHRKKAGESDRRRSGKGNERKRTKKILWITVGLSRPKKITKKAPCFG